MTNSAWPRNACWYCRGQGRIAAVSVIVADGGLEDVSEVMDCPNCRGTGIEPATFDIQNPTAPGNYRQVGQVPGLPLAWQDDTSGQLPAAVMAYLGQAEQQPTEAQLQLVVKYVQHYLHAPAFDHADLAASYAEPLAALRQRSLEIKTVQALNDLVQDSLDLGIDPL